jgi:hypothetical protein
MPLNITAETPRKQRTIGGVVVNVPAPYAEGQAITAGEAAMLNQTLAENFSNNLRRKVEEFVPEGTYNEQNPAPAARLASGEEAQALVDKYATVYEPGVRKAGAGGGRKTLDPIEREMRNIARESLNALLQKQGLKRNEVDYDELLEQVIADHDTDLRNKAAKIVKARESNSLGDLDVSLIAGKGEASGANDEEAAEVAAE